MNNTLKDDISYLRQLAEQGRSAPILGGAFLAAAGVIFGAGCFLQWALIELGGAGWPQVFVLWGGAMILFALVWVLIFLQMRGKGVRATGASNTAFHASWIASGIGITVACIGVGIAASVTNNTVLVLVYPSLVFAFYGTAWLVSANLARRRWMYGAAAGAYVFSVILALLSWKNAQLPAMGAALFLTLTVPGLLLMREKSL